MAPTVDDGWSKLDTSVSESSLADEGLTILSNNEPYTKEEESRVKRKIDFRLVILMLFINGLQYVDKMVFLSYTDIDNRICGDIRNHQPGATCRTRIQLVDKHLLHRLPCRSVSYKLSYATLPNRQIHHSKLYSLGYVFYIILIRVHSCSHRRCNKLFHSRCCSLLPWRIRVLSQSRLRSYNIVLVETRRTNCANRNLVLRKRPYRSAVRINLLCNRTSSGMLLNF
jgi:hypothetical protein